MVGLEIQPDFGRPTEIALKTKGGVNGESPLALHNFVDAARWDADVLSDSILGQAERDQKIFAEDFAGMDWGMCFHGSGSVVIDNFDFVRTV